ARFPLAGEDQGGRRGHGSAHEAVGDGGRAVHRRRDRPGRRRRERQDRDGRPGCLPPGPGPGPQVRQGAPQNGRHHPAHRGHAGLVHHLPGHRLVGIFARQPRPLRRGGTHSLPTRLERERAMSDFNAEFWSVYVAVVTFVSILACLVLLWITARKKIVSDGDNTTGHVWDEDLREMNNPMPRWWMWLFVLTIVFGLLCLVAFRGLGAYEGELRWTQRAEYDAEVEKAKKELAPLYAQFSDRKAEDLAGDPQAMAIGERLFMNNCAQCHGSGAGGRQGTPHPARPDQ